MTLDLIGRAKRMSNDEVMTELNRISDTEHSTMVKVIVLLSEVDGRRTWANKAVPSMFEYCVRYLGYSEGQAFRRIRAARSIQKHPSVLTMLERREIHLTNVAMIFDHLTHPSYETLAREVGMNRKSDALRILARWFPKADIEPSIRPVRAPVAERAVPAVPAQLAMPTPPPPPTPPETATRTPQTAPTPPPTPIIESKLTAMPMPTLSHMPMAQPKPTLPPPAKVEPRSDERYAVKFMADQESHDDLMRAKELLPGADLNELMKRALKLLRHDAEKRLRAKTERPRPPTSKPEATKATKESDVTASAKRAVFERDADQCTYRDDGGNRCSARVYLELDHVVPRAKGGRGTADNIRVRCRAHNRVAAEKEFGRAHIERKIEERRQAVTRGRWGRLARAEADGAN